MHVADAGPLSNNADSVSAPASTRGKSRDRSSRVSAAIADRNRYVDRRRARYTLRAQIREHTSLKRLRACGYWPQGDEGVELRHRDDDDVAYYSGLQQCGSPWSCPVCAAKIRQRHADDIAAAAIQWLEGGRALASMMFTVPHDRGMRLGELWDFVRGAFRKLLSGRYWKRVKRKFGLEGFVRSTETTYGGNGWHPHIHVLLFFDVELDADAGAQLEQIIYERWNAYLRSAGYRDGRRQLFTIEPVRSASSVSSYLAKSGFFEDHPDFAVIDRRASVAKSMPSDSCSYRKYLEENDPSRAQPYAPKRALENAPKIGLELARSDLKSGRNGGRSPFQIFRDFYAEKVERAGDLALWLEWESESKGKRSVEWSRDTIRKDDGSYTFRSFKARFGLEDVDDEELVEQDVGGSKLATISTLEWSALRATDRIGRLLEVAESHGAGGVSFYLEYLANEVMQTGDLSGLDELDAAIDASNLTPKAAGG